MDALLFINHKKGSVPIQMKVLGPGPIVCECGGEKVLWFFCAAKIKLFGAKDAKPLKIADWLFILYICKIYVFMHQKSQKLFKKLIGVQRTSFSKSKRKIFPNCLFTWFFSGSVFCRNCSYFYMRRNISKKFKKLLPVVYMYSSMPRNFFGPTICNM